MAGIDADGSDLPQTDFQLDKVLIDNLGLRQAWDEQREAAAYLLHGEFADFIGQNWSGFLEFADVNWGLDPLQCEDLIRRIEAAAGMK